MAILLTGLLLFFCYLYHRINIFCTKMESAERLLMILNENNEKIIKEV